MPIEIRELNIKTTISEDSQKAVDEIDLSEFKETILKECVEVVLQIIEDQRKR